MLFQMVKKELLMYLRRPRELIILLIMPFVLIAILGTALGAMNASSSTPKLDVKLAIIQKDNPEKAEQSIIQQLESFPLQENVKNTAIEGIKSSNPINILINDVLKSEELSKSIKLDIVTENLSLKEELKYSGVLEIPKSFTEQFYMHAFFEKTSAPQLKLKLNDSSSLEAGLLNDIFVSFQKQITMFSAVNSMGITGDKLKSQLKEEIGEVTTVSKIKPIDTVTYYAIGMSVMFIFYVATTSATFAYEQKEIQIFGRILLADVPISIFFAGIFISTLIVTFFQMNILFGLSALLFKVTWPNLLNYFVVCFLLSVLVGGLAVFISALSYRLKSESTSRQFSSFIVPILAFIGGSYFPVSQLGGVFETLSTYSPAGAGISAYFKIIQGYPLEDISGQMISLVITVIILVAIAIFIQPKRGEAV